MTDTHRISLAFSEKKLIDALALVDKLEALLELAKINYLILAAEQVELKNKIQKQITEMN